MGIRLAVLHLRALSSINVLLIKSITFFLSLSFHPSACHPCIELFWRQLIRHFACHHLFPWLSLRVCLYTMCCGLSFCRRLCIDARTFCSLQSSHGAQRNTQGGAWSWVSGSGTRREPPCSPLNSKFMSPPVMKHSHPSRHCNGRRDIRSAVEQQPTTLSHRNESKTKLKLGGQNAMAINGRSQQSPSDLPCGRAVRGHNPAWNMPCQRSQPNTWSPGRMSGQWPQPDTDSPQAKLIHCQNSSWPCRRRIAQFAKSGARTPPARRRREVEPQRHNWFACATISCIAGCSCVTSKSWQGRAAPLQDNPSHSQPATRPYYPSSRNRN